MRFEPTDSTLERVEVGIYMSSYFLCDSTQKNLVPIPTPTLNLIFF